MEENNVKRIKRVSADEYSWIGEVDLGVLGRFKDGMITVDLDGCEVVGLDEDSPEDERIEKLSSYYEERFDQLAAAKDSLSEQFMMWMIEYLCDLEYPFWKKGSDQSYPSYIRVNEMDKYKDSKGNIAEDADLKSLIYSDILEYDVYNNADGLKSHEIAEKYLPVLDFMQMVSTIQPEYLSTCEEEISFQVGSRICNGLLFCGTYGTIDTSNELVVTHNC